MLDLEELMDIKSLKTNFLSDNLGKTEPRKHYDKENDVFSFLFTSSKDRLIVHYVDDYVALLYRYSDNEVVGLRVESFLREFLPKYATSKKEWKLSETGICLKEFDLKIQCEIKRIPKYSHRVISANIEKEQIYLQPA